MYLTSGFFVSIFWALHTEFLKFLPKSVNIMFRICEDDFIALSLEKQCCIFYLELDVTVLVYFNEDL